jgi:hypothetical protein
VPNVLKPTRVRRIHRPIPHVPVQIRITGRKSNGIFTQPPPNTRIVPPVEIVLQTGRRIEEPARVGKGLVHIAGPARGYLDAVEVVVRFGRDVAEAVKRAVQSMRAEVVDHVADAAENKLFHQSLFSLRVTQLLHLYSSTSVEL